MMREDSTPFSDRDSARSHSVYTDQKEFTGEPSTSQPSIFWPFRLFSAAGSFAVYICWFASVCVSVAGVLLLLWLLIVRALTPAQAHFSAPLYFDYTKSAAIALAPLLPEQRIEEALISKEPLSFLKPRQQADIWMELLLPDGRATVPAEVVQVTGELLSADGRRAAKTSRPCLVPSTYQTLLQRLTSLVFTPLSIAGMHSDYISLHVSLFKGYTEKPDIPFVLFKATLEARAGAPSLPLLHEAWVHVEVYLGPLTRALFWMRPGTGMTVILVAVGVGAICGGGLCAVLIMAWLWVTSGPRAHRGAAALSEDESGSEPGSEPSSGRKDDVAGSGVDVGSEASDLQSGRGGSQDPLGMADLRGKSLTAGPSAPTSIIEELEIEGEGGLAGAPGLGAKRVGARYEAGRPLDSSMLRKRVGRSSSWDSMTVSTPASPAGTGTSTPLKG